MPRESRAYFRVLKERLHRRFAREQIRATRQLHLTSEEVGDTRMERLMTILGIFNVARMPNGQSMSLALQQREFVMKVVNASLPIIYGSCFDVRVKRERILRRLGFKKPEKTLVMRTPRQFGKTTVMMMVIAALACAFPSFHLLTAQLLDVAQKMIMGVGEIVRVLCNHAPPGLMMPTIDKKHDSVNRVWLLWPGAAKSVVKRFTAKRKRYVPIYSPHMLRARDWAPPARNTFLCLCIP